MKVKKIIIISLCLLLIASYLLFINTTYVNFIDIEQSNFNNCYLNSQANIISQLAYADDKLYYNYNNNFFKYGTYEISETVTKRIYWEGPSVLSPTLSLDNIVDDKILHNNINNDKLEYFDIKEKKYLSYFDIKSTPNFKPKSYFIANGEYYYYDSEFSLYKITANNNVELVLSNELIGFESYSTPQFYNNYIYFIATRNINENDVEEYLCKYDTNSKKIVSEMLYYKGDVLSGGLKRFSCSIVANNKVYGFASNVYNELPLDNNTYVYVADIENKTSKSIFKTDSNVILNCYEDKVFMCVENGNDKGIYYINTINNEVTKIFDSEKISGLYIVDSTWLYFIGKDNNLYRVTQDGKILEKVFG